MKTKSLVGLEVSPSTIEAQKLFSELVDTLGYPSKEAILRRSEGSFVPVRVDVWKNPGSGPNIWFVATNREITLAVINTGDFPIDQVFIRPDPERFFVDPTRKDTVQDIDREIIQEKTQQSQSEKVEISGVKTNFDSKQTTNATKKDNEPVTPELRIRGVTPISYLIVVIVLLVSLVTLIFLRIRKR